LEDGQREARAALERLGITSEDTTKARRSLEGLRANRERREALVQRHTELQDELGRHEQTVRMLAERHAQIDLAEAAARQGLATVGIVGGPETWAVELVLRRERFSVRETAVHDVEAQEEIRRILVGSDNPDEWWPRMAERRAAGVRPSPEDTRTLEQLRVAARHRRDELENVRNTLAQVETRREERSRGLADPAALAEELDEATVCLARLQYRPNVLQAASALIRAVSEEHRRNFAPRLADSVSSWLELATAHRYARVEVSPTDLSVALASRDRGGLVTLDQVSRGTRDTVALLFRASIVDLLSNTDEPVPLFLDDPLVNVDAERAQNIFAILGDLAQTRQIFYCTHDPRIVEWIKRIGDCRVITMEAAA
jgi:DNA repair exonuclease SbcCD ATPase subunit